LNASGFKVYVNVKYLRQNKIPNTRSIKIPLEKIIKFTEMVGNVISVRSGICDVISSSKCNLIVLYPSQNIYSWSSLKKMGLRKMVKEYIIDSPSNRKLIKQIVNNCKKVI
jgi:hypothetical protein